MKLVFALYKYFPFGGLQKDMLAIAEECVRRGHEVDIFCRNWTGDKPAWATVHILPTPAWCMSNHSKDSWFSRQVIKKINQLKPALVIGFNKIPGVDIYYAADTCFKAKLYRERPSWYRCLPRYRVYMKEEAALFGKASHTHILAISRAATLEYSEFYQTDAQRFTLLPPGISRDRVNTSGERLYALHNELGLTENNLLVLMVGSGFRTKGLDRAIKALVALPDDIREQTHLVVVGQDNSTPFLQQAAAAGIEERVHFLGGRKDIPTLLRSADVLIHPAYREAAGMALLEAAVAGLPVIATDVCGYSHYLAQHDLGIVLTSPFTQAALDAALLKMLTDTESIKRWRDNGLHFGQHADIYSMPARAADTIERLAGTKQ